MKQQGNANAGIGDPYFYEWTIGQKKILEMLNPDNCIASVVLQKGGFTGIDDVVVNYVNGTTECIQVKNTRTGNTLTFNDLVYAEKEEEPLLKQLAAAWNEAEKKNPNTSVVLTSNRSIGSRTSTKRDNTKLPSLQNFWKDLKAQIDRSTTVQDLKFDPKFETAFSDFKKCLSGLSSDKQIKFLKVFDLDGDAPDLEGLEAELKSNISKTFGVPADGATRIFRILDHGLRRWATSLRESEEVTPEVVLLELSRDENNNLGDHDISPPAPFFPTRVNFLKSLEETILKSPAKVTFLYGVPGSGKTSLISSLANHVDPVVHLRFHAFRPISPESKLLSADTSLVCSPKALWGDLLNQIRRHLRGRLAKYRVPVINDFLTISELREHFIRLAVAYSKEIQRKVIIAVDGIDHAARAGIDGKNLLDSLISPESIPDDLHFIIAGQPSQSYGEYPFWLRTETKGVTRIEVPLLKVQDLELLCKDHGISFPGCSVDAIAKLILSKSEGNTLPSVFAAHEAKQCSTFEELERRLASSQLSGNLGVYYDGIWSKLIKSLGDGTDTKQTRIAAALCLLSQRINPKDLVKAYPDLNIGEAYWKEHLLTLYPMVVRDTAGFRVLHNDVRIFLNGILGSKKELFKEASMLLLQHIAKEDDFAVCRHADLGNLLKAAEKDEAILDFVSPQFVSEGWSYGRHHNETAHYLQVALSEASKSGDWSKVHSVVMAIDTLRQLVRVTHASGFSTYHFDHNPNDSSDSIVMSVEKYVLNPKEWTLSILNEVFESIQELHGLAQTPRAVALFERWFRGFNLLELFNILPKDEIYEYRDQLSNSFRDVVVKFGYWSSLLNSKCFTCRANQEEDNDRWIFAALISGRAKGAATKSKYAWARQLKKIPVWFPDIFEEILDELFKDRKWEHLRLFFRAFDKRSLSKQIQVKLTAYLILANETKATAFFKGITDNWKGLLKDGSFGTDVHELYFWTAFALGYLQHTRPLLGITEEIQNLYFTGRGDSRERPPFARITYAAALLGQLLRIQRNGGNLSSYESEIRASFQAVNSIYELRHSYFLHNVNSAVRLLNFGFSQFRNSISKEFLEHFRLEMLKMAESRPANGQLEPLWQYLVDENEMETLAGYYSYYFADDGVAWNNDVYERLSLVETFKPLALKLGWKDKVVETDRRLSQRTVGFDNHKDYVMHSPLQWYCDLNSAKYEIGNSELLKLLKVNHAAGELGDNRFSFEIETELLLQLIGEGPARVWQFLCLFSSEDKRRWFNLDAPSFFNAVIRSLEANNFSSGDLLALWCIGIGGLSWTNENDQSTIGDLRNAILEASKRISASQELESRMKELGKTEYQVKGRDHNKKTWWFNRKKDVRVEEILDQTKDSDPSRQIESILALFTNENRSQIFDALAEVLQLAKTNGTQIPEELASRVFSRSLKESYGYSWDMDGLDDLVLAVSPHIKSDQVFHSFLSETVEKVKATSGNDLRLWVDSISNNVDQLCRYRALTTDNAKLREGLMNWLELLEYWSLGSSKRKLEEPVFDSEMPLIPNSWSEFGVIYLGLLSNSTMTEQIFAALRGLYALSKSDPNSMHFLTKVYFVCRADVRMRILGLCERLVSEDPDMFLRIEPIIDAATESDQLGESLQGWIVRNAYARSKGMDKVRWKYSRGQKKHSNLNTTPAVITKAQRVGSRSFSTGYSAIEVLIKQLATFVNLDIDDFAAEVFAAKRLTKDETSIPFGFRVARLDRGIRATPDSEVISLYEVVGDYVVDWGVEESLAEALATSLLKSDDPFLVFDTPTNISENDVAWPIEEDLEKLLSSSGGEFLVQESLNKVSDFDLPSGFKILCAYASSYTNRMDVEYFSAFGPKAEAMNFKRKPQPFSFNGRLLSLSFSDIPHPISNPKSDWTSWRAGGLSEYSAVQLMPSSFVMEELNLIPSHSDPRCWLNESGETILKFEQFTGPIRSKVFEPYFRQPKLQRWVIREAELNDLLASRDLEFKKWVDRSDYERPR